jgi:hypothetical protein
MQLIVRDPTGTGRRLVCEVASSDTIGSLMEYLETTWAIPISRQRLIFSGKQLEPGRSFEVYNIQTESTLDLVLRRDRIPTVDSTLRRAREIKIFVKLAYQERSFEIAEDATINDLKQEIESVLGIDWLRQRLVCNYKVIRIRDGRLQLNSVPVPSHSHVSVEIITSTPYKVQVRMPDGFSHTVEVIYSEPIAQVKRIITEVTGFPEAEFQLCFENALLSGDDILADCRIDPNSTLDFLSSPAIEEGKEVEILVAYELVDQSEDVVAEYAAPTEAFTIRPSDLVRVLKNQIAASTTIPVHLQEVVHEGTILRDERTFQSYGVKTRHVLQARLLEEEEISIQLKGADGRDIPGIVIKNWLSVADLKREVAGRNGVPDDLDFFEIVLSGAALKDDFALFSCRINSGRKLDIRLRESPPWCDKPFAELEPGNASDKDTPEPDASQLTYRIDRHLHLLADNSAELAKGRWRDLRQLLPEVLRGDIEYKSRGHLSSCWTFTPSEEVSPSDVPLAIAGAPVIIPVDYRYPLMGLLAPPPDPYPFVINPVAPLNMQTVVRIFKTFEHALGFYILINGMLQIVVPEGFDYEWASSYKPNAFGGLKVCYIGESLTPTVDRSEAASETSFNRSIGKAASRSFFSSFRLGQQDRRIGAVPGLKLDQSVEARVKESRAKERHVGRIGIKTCHKSLIYLTMSTHVITSAVTAKQRDRFYQKLLSNSQTQLDANWINKVEIYADDLRVSHDPHICASLLTIAADWHCRTHIRCRGKGLSTGIQARRQLNRTAKCASCCRNHVTGCRPWLALAGRLEQSPSETRQPPHPWISETRSQKHAVFWAFTMSR